MPGRRTGRPRRTLLVQVTSRDQQYLVSLAGESEWVRNVRAAQGMVTLSAHGRRYAARLSEVPTEQRAQVISAYFTRPSPRGRAMVRTAEARHYFGVEPDASMADLSAIAGNYPAFRIDPASPTTEERRSSSRSAKEASWTRPPRPAQPPEQSCEPSG